MEQAMTINSLDEATKKIRDSEQNIRDNWVAMAETLIFVRDNKLWEENGHTGFDSYIKSELGYGRQWVYKLMKTPEVAAVIPVTNPTVASELVALPEEQWEQAWQAAKQIAQTNEPSSRHVRRAVKAMRRGTPFEEEVSRLTRQPDLAPEPEGADEDAEQTLKEALAEWDTINSMMRQVYGAIEELSKEKLGVWIDMNAVKTDFRNLNSVMKFSKPHQQCHLCGGEGCDKCLNSGWLNQERSKAYSD
tara:strand:- start:1021 stop:1761 length:741 start_codon:yes stop_codon:yes gene_type:complete